MLGQQCTGQKLLEACRPVGANTFTVFARVLVANIKQNVGTIAHGHDL